MTGEIEGANIERDARELKRSNRKKETGKISELVAPSFSSSELF